MLQHCDNTLIESPCTKRNLFPNKNGNYKGTTLLQILLPSCLLPFPKNTSPSHIQARKLKPEAALQILQFRQNPLEKKKEHQNPLFIPTVARGMMMLGLAQKDEGNFITPVYFSLKLGV